ncbi:type II secretion system protein [Campylobacter showae]|uniref:type II secretion system protein n=1 Tax=Campylobacter showae TaxID=204 RepID=UPI001E547DEC|nr:prepilin-type N-terminal cleavage/methylation domain-containing protein [Campylobacter showae]
MKRAFTMIELVFTIVIIGILAAIAVPRLFVSRDDAVLVRARSDIASIKSAVTNAYNANMLTGNFTYPALEKAGSTTGLLFENVLQNGIKIDNKSGWTKDGNDYIFTLRGSSTRFTYDQASGTFSCPRTDSLCSALTE